MKDYANEPAGDFVTYPIGPDKQIFERKIVNICLLTRTLLCFSNIFSVILVGII